MTSETLRISVRQNSVLICTASTFTDSQAHFIAINRQTKLVYKKYGLPKSHQDDIYGLTKPRARNIAKNALLLVENGGEKRYVRLSQKQT